METQVKTRTFREALKTEDIEALTRIHNAFVRRWEVTYADLSIPAYDRIREDDRDPGKAMMTLVGYAREVAQRFPRHTWTQIESAWHYGCRRHPDEKKFNIGILLSWLTAYLPDIADPEEERPAPVPVSDAEAFDAYLPRMVQGIENNEPFWFSNPGAVQVWPELQRRVGKEREKGVSEQVIQAWLEKVERTLNIRISERETITEFRKRVEERAKMGRSVAPDAVIDYRIAMFKEFQKMQEEKA